MSKCPFTVPFYPGPLNSWLSGAVYIPGAGGGILCAAYPGEFL